MYTRNPLENDDSTILRMTGNNLSDKQAKNAANDDFDYTVSGERWKGVIMAVRNRSEDQLKSQLLELHNDVQKQKYVSTPAVSTFFRNQVRIFSSSK